MAEYTDREHYIPIRKGELVQLLLQSKDLPLSDRDQFQKFCQLLTAVYHFEYLERLEKLKDAFAPLDPDAEAPPLKPLDLNQRDRLVEKVFQEFVGLMERANFKHLTRADIQAAIDGGASDWGINMYVNWDVFERLEVFARGEGQSKRTKRHWLFWWKKYEKTVETYSRLVLMVKLKPHKSLPANVDTQDVYFKYFKDIPKLDLEMVLPGTQLTMPRSQRYKLGGSILGTVAYIVWKMGRDLVLGAAAILSGALGAVSWGAFAVIGGYAYRQYAGYQFTKTSYAKMLSESLYYQNLDNNSGVLTRLLDEAEEQEVREVMLAYYCLWRYAPPQGWNSGQIDDYVEMFLEGLVNLKVDFEIGDAMEKVEKLGLVEKTGDLYRPVPLATALERLDYRWDNYFQYNKG